VEGVGDKGPRKKRNQYVPRSRREAGGVKGLSHRTGFMTNQGRGAIKAIQPRQESSNRSIACLLARRCIPWLQRSRSIGGNARLPGIVLTGAWCWDQDRSDSILLPSCHLAVLSSSCGPGVQRDSLGRRRRLH
jgi:hypothetical protein